MLTLDYLNGWLFGIDVNRVKPEFQERILIYQRECYCILADAFLERNLPSEMSPAYASLARVREMALAIAELASQQMEFERRMTTTESRLDRAAQVVGDMDKRLKTVERRTAPGQPISEEQAAEVSQQVKALAMLLSEKKGGEVHYQAIWGELYRQFGVTSYKLIPQSKYEAVLAFLADWHGRANG